MGPQRLVTFVISAKECSYLLVLPLQQMRDPDPCTPSIDIMNINIHDVYGEHTVAAGPRIQTIITSYCD